MPDIRLAATDILFREGTASRRVYRIVSGEIEVTRQVAGGVAVLGRVGPGAFVGEMGTLVWAPRNGTARAATDTVLSIYRREEFLEHIASDPDASALVVNNLSLRTRAQVEFLRRAQTPPRRASRFQRTVEALRTRLRRTPYSAGLSAEIAGSNLAQCVYEPGELLFEEGTASGCAFWIESGQVRVGTRDERGEVRMAGRAGPREFLGEMGVLESLPRAASAHAETRVTVRILTASEFSDLLRRSPAAVLTVIDALCERARRAHALGAGAWNSGGSLLDALRTVDSMAQLAEQRLIDEAARARAYIATQLDRGKTMTATYQKFLRGRATSEELEQANAVLRDYAKMAGIGTLLVLPGAPLTIPLVAKLGKALGVDIFPSESGQPVDSRDARPS